MVLGITTLVGIAWGRFKSTGEKLSLIKDGFAMKSSDFLAESGAFNNQLLCILGGDSGPKTFMRFM